MMKKYCKTYFVIAAVFIVLSFIGDNNMFFVFYLNQAEYPHLNIFNVGGG